MYRRNVDLSGLWMFKTDASGVGESENWQSGFDSATEVAVPGSWNEQLAESGLMNYVGAAWYMKTVYLQPAHEGEAMVLRIGSADFLSKVWVNGICVGENTAGFLPFECDITGVASRGGTARIVIRVTNELSNNTIPQGITSAQYEIENRLREETFPPARFDFFPFGGIHRPVRVLTVPVSRLDRVSVETTRSDGGGIVTVSCRTTHVGSGELRARLGDAGAAAEAGASAPVVGTISSDAAVIRIIVPDCRCWSPEDPFLYTLTLEVMKDGLVVDEYSLEIGIREVRIDGNRLLLNGKEIRLTGFGKHEDGAITGKGLSLPLMVKDFELLKWIGANSFRTSHYPYAEEFMFYADKKGILVIDEVPAVSLDHRHTTDRTLAAHKEYIARLIERDRNHPSVIIWSLGNEPNLVGAESYFDGRGKAYWEEVFACARELDPLRPMVVPNCLRGGIHDPVLALSDILCINRYYGWYEYPGQLARGIEALGEEMDAIHAKYRKPLMLTEFGADTIAGFHSITDQMFTEEYQSRLLGAYIALARSKQYTIGEHVWNFADFRTPQNMRRVMFNLKGVFTRSRDPKMAAFTLRDLWTSSPKEK